MATKTKFFSSAMSGAPVLSNVASSLIGILDAVLVNGWGQVTLTDLTVAAGIATATFAAAPPFVVDSVALIAGATPVGLNGEKRVLSVGALTITFAAVGIADGTATGVITCKVAPAGWSKLFTGVNLAAYKSTAPESTGFVLRVDDTGTTVARVRGYESMTDVNTGLGPFPTIAQQALPGLWWPKATAVGRPWHLIGDDRGFYFIPQPQPGTNEGFGLYFGDLLPIRGSDPYACVLRAHTADWTNTTANVFSDLCGNGSGLSAGSGLYVTRNASGLGGAQQAWNAFPVLNSASATFSGSTFHGTFPSPVDNGLHVVPMSMIQDQNVGLRAWFPGVYACLQNVASQLSTDDTIDGTGAMAGKRLRAMKMNSSTVGVSQAMLFFDVLNDWR